MQALLGYPLDFSEGAFERALIETNAGMGISLESQIVYLVAVSRAQTSQGADLDSWCEQFNFPRIAAEPAFGNDTFSRYTPTLQATIPVGSELYSISNAITYSVQADDTNPNFSPALNAYILAAGINSITVPIIALTPGTVGNALSNQITTLSSVVPYVDFVTNPSPLDNGKEAESDSAYRARFILYINGLSKGTYQALLEAVSSVAGVERKLLVENKNINNTDHYGFFYALIDDGTGNASPTLINQAYAALDATRGFTIQQAVYGPTQFTISISMSVTTDGTQDDPTVQNEIVSALQTYITSQGFNAFFAYSEIPKFAYDADSSVTNVVTWTLNGLSNDIQLTGQNIPVVGSLVVSVN
jgi:uncharacterized phage protein gp47/JayE